MQKYLFILLFATSLFAREYIAIIDFEGIGVTEVEAKALTQRLTSEMIALEVYQVLERSKMKKLLEEQKFQYSGCVNLQCAVEIGQMLGAKYMVVGSISKVGSTYSTDARLINVETSESYISANYDVSGEIDNLLKLGMKSIAYQLCEIAIEEPMQITDKKYYDKLSMDSKINDNMGTLERLLYLEKEKTRLREEASRIEEEQGIPAPFNYEETVDKLARMGEERKRLEEELKKKEGASSICVDFIVLWSASDIAERIGKDKKWVFLNYNVDLWDTPPTQRYGDIVGKLKSSSYARIIEIRGDDYKVVSPINQVEGWLNKEHVKTIVKKNLATYEFCE